jgi:hypothetical protein
VEPTEEQWPTSNGMFTTSCSWRCKCEALTPERILGVGNAYDHSEHQVDMSQDKRNTGPFVDLIDFGTSPSQRTNESCIPDCLPASWRRDLANGILGTNSSSKLHIVPVWRQLVERGVLNAKLPFDCTHKSADALMVMTQQLVRSMLQVLSQ